MTTALDRTLVTVTEPISVAAEQYRVLGAKLDKLSKDLGPRIIAVTSSVKNEGKTLTSINLSIVMAKDFHRRVLLVETDFKSPMLSRLLGRKMNGGFVDILSKQTDLDRVALTYFDGRLAVLTSGKSLGDDLRLLGSEQAREFFRQMKTQYDYIVLDLPPILPLADAHVITQLADGVIMVIRAGHTPQYIVKRAMAELDTRKVLGVILNDVSSTSPYYYYYYHHQTK